MFFLLSILLSCSKDNSNLITTSSKPTDNEKYIKIVSPGAGETFPKSMGMYIKTESKGVDAVTIYLLHNHNNILTIQNNYVSPTSMVWIVDNSLIADSSYTIKVEDRDQKNIFDESASFFNINESISIQYVWSFYPSSTINYFRVVFSINKVTYSKFTGDGLIYNNDGTTEIIKISGSFNYPTEFQVNMVGSYSNITFTGTFNATNQINGRFSGRVGQNQFSSASASILHN